MRRPRYVETFVGVLLTASVYSTGFSVSSFSPRQIDYATGPQSTEQAKPEGPQVSNGAEQQIATYTLWLMIFTGILGASTILLWWETKQGGRVTDRLAKAAELSAKAAIGVDLPVIRAWSPDLSGLDREVPDVGSIGSIILDLSPTPFCYVPTIKFQNFGRTNAFLESIRIGWDVCRALPPEPIYRASVTPRGSPIGLANDEDGEEIDTPRHTIRLSREQIEQIDAREAFLWFFAEYAYVDFMRVRHEARFCWQWACPDGVGVHYLAAVGHPPETYTRHT